MELCSQDLARVDALPSIGRVPREQITACLIVQNERDRLPTALKSVAFCDEILVIDGGSTDGTTEIARTHGARVIENPWPGFAVQRNVALGAANNDWILEIDADECVSPQLRASIETLLAAPAPSAAIAVCALRNRFLGRLLGPSAKYPMYRARMFRRDVYRHDESRKVHEGLKPRERPLVLDGDLEHELAETVHEALADTWRYARLESLHVARPSTIRTCFTSIVLRPCAKLVYRTVVDGGWRDGWRGLMKIALDATSDALVWMLALTRSNKNSPAAVGESQQGHFGRRPAGPPKIVAVSGDGEARRIATRWLSGLQKQGIDVVLISTAHSPNQEARADCETQTELSTGDDVPLQAAKNLRPLAVIRALEIETQLRTIDAVLAIGRRARLVQHFVPSTLWPTLPGLNVALDPETAAWEAKERITHQ